MFYYDFILLQNDFQCWCEEIAPIEKKGTQSEQNEARIWEGCQMNEAVGF